MATPKIYAKPGTNEYVRCEPWQVPEGFVQMNAEHPLGGEGPYVADETGEWLIPPANYTEDYNEIVRIQRARAYAEQIPIESQLEAITEDRLGRPEKLNEILATIQEIKTKYPKI